MAVAKKRNIRRSTGFDKKEMEGYFMIANKDAAIAIVNKLTGSQLRLWLYLMMVDSFADLTTDGEKVYHSIPSPQEIAIKIGASPETVEKDIRKLKKLGLYEYRVIAWRGHNLSAANAKEESERLKKKKAETKSPHGGGLNKPPERLNKPPERLNKPPKRLNKPPVTSETLEKSSILDGPQTIQTYSDFKKTLSDSERENFLKFVEEKTKNLEKPINDLEAWLASKNAANQNRWEVYHERFKIEGQDNLALQEKLEAEKRAIANFQNRHNLKNRTIESKKRDLEQNNAETLEKVERERRAIANFQKHINRDLPVDDNEPENTNSEEYRRQKAAFDELLSSSLGEKEESLARRRRKEIAKARQKQQELARQRREAAARYSEQQDVELQRRKERKLREIAEFNQC